VVLSLPRRQNLQRPQSALQAVRQRKMYLSLDLDLKANFSPFQKKEHLHEPASGTSSSNQSRPRRASISPWLSHPALTRNSIKSTKPFGRSSQKRRRDACKYPSVLSSFRNLKTARTNLLSTAANANASKTNDSNFSNADKNSNPESRNFANAMRPCDRNRHSGVLPFLCR
jgi:hypothetical protein